MAGRTTRLLLSLKLAVTILNPFLALLLFSATPLHGLNIGVQSVNSGITAVRINHLFPLALPLLISISDYLEPITSVAFSAEQAAVQQEVRYCGIMYSGCPGEKACDALDACCMVHDACVQSKRTDDYLSQECNENFLHCIAGVRASRKGTFKGNKCMVEEVVEVMTLVIEAALLAGRVLHKP
ncbi:hypothetical protein BHE74_00039012 [Ensete ventricosum]|uniref:Phospholipase A2 domain-containing protein n=1 Tax=Ensete ventricosum TaxID=4639 RepID=A0A444CNM7_ENSVE|nr:hypothetical protein B296_00016372 [Ensete ventricosum]RWV87458.1 hypothetical protein GW17_00050540 [Ensete ventricosum]RWW54414.1 hypothetical protein BHE74_00039012 [Ensete ventricosum]RZR74189.1 hypothetical protein BHM03_00033274 [Ensete ventricosum]